MTLPFVCIGHLAICCAIYNQTHASALPRWTRKLIERLIILVVLSGFGFFLYRRLAGYKHSFEDLFQQPVLFGLEFGLLTVAAAMIVRWFIRKLLPRAAFWTQHEIHRYQLKSEIDSPLLNSWDAKLLDRIPGNQSTHLWVEEKSVQLPNLPPSMHGFVISHLSDLHFTGKLDRAYYEKVVEYSNAKQPDLVCITGDIVDTLECVDWVEPVLGKLQSRLGVLYILGNHDKRVRDIENLRWVLEKAGMTAANNKWQTILDGEVSIQFAGNELPWFRGAEKMAALDRERSDNEFRLLLSHSPDEFEFGCRKHADLILAGHTHGGQIRFPLIGPIVAPSRMGVKYASKPFFKSGQTIMHVTRGIAGDDIIRIMCAPEIAILKLQQASEMTSKNSGSESHSEMDLG